MSKKIYWKVGAAFVLVLLVIILVLQNRQEVPTHLLFYTVVLPNAATLTITFCLGFLLGILTMILARGGGKGTSEMDKAGRQSGERGAREVAEDG